MYPFLHPILDKLEVKLKDFPIQFLYVTVVKLVDIITLTPVRNREYLFLEPFTVQSETWLVIMVCVYNYSKPYIKVACYNVQ